MCVECVYLLFFKKKNKILPLFPPRPLSWEGFCFCFHSLRGGEGGGGGGKEERKEREREVMVLVQRMKKSVGEKEVGGR